MKKSVVLMLLMTMAMSFAFLFVGCSNNQSNENYNYNNIMQSVDYSSNSYGVYCDKNTKVMYIRGTDSNSSFTVMVDSNGKPQLYNEKCNYNGVMQSVDYESGSHWIWYDKNTKVMYIRRTASDSTFTVMVNADGSPQLYNGNNG